MGKQSRLQYLIKNTAIFAIGNISIKFVHFFLVPYYTYAMTAEQYGTVDMLVNICSILIPLMMCNIGEAVRRYLLDKCSNDAEVCTISLIWNLVGAISSVILYVVLQFVPQIREYAFSMCLYSFTCAFASTAQDYLRGKEKLGIYTINSVLSTVLVASLNILFLSKFNLGVHGYLWAYIITYTVFGILNFIVSGQYKNIRNLRFDRKLFKEMSGFSIALVPNSLMWWIINSSDRLMLTSMVSATANGLFAVACKLPSMMSTFNTILMQAWQYSAVKEANSADKVEYNNKMFQFYFSSMTIIGGGLLLIIRPFMSVYVAPEFHSAWIYSPFLIVGFMFQTLGTFVGTSYYVQKDMKGNLISASIGAAVNIILNFSLITLLGTIGAAIASCISYIVILVYRLYDTKKYMPIKFFDNNTIAFTVLIVIMMFGIYLQGFISYLIMIPCYGFILWINRTYVVNILKSVRNKMLRK